MAAVIGEPARYLTHQVIQKLRKTILVIFLAFYVFSFALGYLVGGRQPYWLITFLVFMVALPVILWSTDRLTRMMEKERMDLRKGATGETLTAYLLDGLPDDYMVIHDITTSHGNIDHVVVGPSGVFAIDTKNWKGVVAADGKGELLLNGKPTDKTEVKNLVRRIMRVKDNIRDLSSLSPYIQGLMVFSSARVEAKWGTTGPVHCIRDEQLYEYIAESKNSKKLAKEEMEAVSQAFLEFARKDKDFVSCELITNEQGLSAGEPKTGVRC